MKSMKNIRKSKGWVVRGERPEETCGSPEIYYTDEEIKKYSSSGAIRRTQEKIAYRIMQLLDMASGLKLLDLGCGPGFTMSVYKNEGYNVVGIDVLPKMLGKAKENRLNVVQGDVRELKNYFSSQQFDAVVSASALQWLKDKKDINDAAKGINYILKLHGKIVFQFYPKSQDELENFASVLIDNGFEGNIITDNPDNPVKRTIYLVMEKIK